MVFAHGWEDARGFLCHGTSNGGPDDHCIPECAFVSGVWELPWANMTPGDGSDEPLVVLSNVK